MGTELLPWVLTAGWASGINSYATVLVLGLLGRFGPVGAGGLPGIHAIPHDLTRTDVLIVAAALFAIEFVVDKIPYADSIWDAVHTVVRPSVGAVVSALLAGQDTSAHQALAATTGGVLALVSHLAKAALRAVVNTSPEPASNIVLSTGEDAAVAGLLALATAHPWVSATAALALLVAMACLAAALWRRVLRFRDRWRRRWAG